MTEVHHEGRPRARRVFDRAFGKSPARSDEPLENDDIRIAGGRPADVLEHERSTRRNDNRVLAGLVTQGYTGAGRPGACRGKAVADPGLREREPVAGPVLVLSHGPSEVGLVAERGKHRKCVSRTAPGDPAGVEHSGKNLLHLSRGDVIDGAPAESPHHLHIGGGRRKHVPERIADTHDTRHGQSLPIRRCPAAA